MPNTHEMFTARLLQCLQALKVPKTSDQEKLSLYLRGFKANDIIFQNTEAGKSVASFVIFLLTKKFPQIMQSTFSSENRKIVEKFAYDVNMAEGLKAEATFSNSNKI